MPKIKLIVGSTRPKRFSEKPAQWFFELLKKREDMESELLDLRDWPLPFYSEEFSPSTITNGNYPNELAKKWAAKIAEADGFVVVTPEYNHGYPAVLKNAFDWIYAEWNNKPIGFVSYGSALGARSVEQLREVAVELQMAPIRNALLMPRDIVAAARNEPFNSEFFKTLEERADGLIDQLLWWARALKVAREQK